MNQFSDYWAINSHFAPLDKYIAKVINKSKLWAT